MANTIDLAVTGAGNPAQSIPTVFQATVNCDAGWSVHGVELFDPGDSTDGQQMSLQDDDGAGAQVYECVVLNATPGDWMATAAFAQDDPNRKSATANIPPPPPPPPRPA